METTQQQHVAPALQLLAATNMAARGCRSYGAGTGKAGYIALSHAATLAHVGGESEWVKRENSKQS